MATRQDELRQLQSVIRTFSGRLAIAGAFRAAWTGIFYAALAALLITLIAWMAGASRGLGLSIPALIPLVAMIAGIIGWRRNHQSDYHAAQIIDSELGKGDRISSAWYLLSTGDVDGNPFAELAIQDGLAAAKNAAKVGRPRSSSMRPFAMALISTCVSVSTVAFLFPPKVISPEEAVSAETAGKMQKMMKTLSQLSSANGKDDTQMKELLEQLNMSAEDMAKMTQADVMRMLNEKGIKVGNAEKAKAIEAIKSTLADMELINKKMAEIEKRNNMAYGIKTKDGSQISGARIKTTVTDEAMLVARLKSAAGLAENDSEITAEMERESKEAQLRAKEARAKAGLQGDVQYTVDASKMLKGDEKFQNDVRDAVADPTSEAAQRVKKTYKDIARKDIEKGDIPPGAADKMMKWIKNQ